jgi:predicted metal-binding protein
MMTPVHTSELERLARSLGFESTGLMDPSELMTRSEVRDMCSSGSCKAYGHNWSCPPACGSIEEYQDRFATYTRCLLVQTVVELEDEFDIETMLEGEAQQKKRFLELVGLIRAQQVPALFLSAGTCTLCASCSYPDQPCRRPDERLTSMEAAGLLVSDVCTQAGIPYNHGAGTIAYTSCILY